MTVRFGAPVSHFLTSENFTVAHLVVPVVNSTAIGFALSGVILKP